MKDAQKPDHVSLNALISRLKEGRFVIPDFQREFEWQPWDIRDLVRSIFLDYYIGSLLLWKGKKENFTALSCEPIYGYAGCDSNREYIVLDGQQRLTAMYYVFMSPDTNLPNRANRYVYYVRVDKFMAEEYDEAFNYDWTQRGMKALSQRDSQYAAHIFPLSVVGKGGWELYNWLQGYAQFWSDRATTAQYGGDVESARAAHSHVTNAAAFGEHLKGITEEYQIAYIELDRDIAIDKVCDIFTQINSKGVQLDTFDLFNALLKPKGLQLKQMYRKAAPALAFIDSDKMNVYILQVMSILRQGYCSPKYLYYLLPGQEKTLRDPDGSKRKEILILDTKDFTVRWQQAVVALQNAIKLLKHPQEFGAISASFLPYISILPVFSALQAHAKTLPSNKQLAAQRKIRHWYWASVFTNRYSGAVESTSARDFLDVKAWLEDDSAEPSLLLEFRARFRTLDLRKEVRRGTSLYNGVFNLLVIQGARDWMTGNVPQYDDLDDHHIVPASWGAKQGNGVAINSILNRTPLTADTNRRVIGDRLPNVYLPDLIKESGDTTVREILGSHFISPDAQAILLRNPFTPSDFEEFITKRQHTFQEAIEHLLIKERLDLSPRLRELDEKIEKVELTLRQTINVALDGNPKLLPQPVLLKVDDRLQRALARNAALDAEQYKQLSGKLEFCDLRELQDVITNGSLWSRFQPRFANKETLNGKFNQLAELRNGIRHSRAVDQITQKEGEASIMWFEQVLAK